MATFERELAAYCGAAHCVAAANGTVTLQAALVALGVKPSDRVATTPLTMAATTIAILNVGATPVYEDVEERTWLMKCPDMGPVAVPVSLYGLHASYYGGKVIDDAAQTLRPHNKYADFTSLSFQRSKILNTGEGGALLTNDADLAERARSYLSLGYRMNGQARIDSNALKSPTFDRHHMYPSINGRMNDLTAARGLEILPLADFAIARRRDAADLYRDAVAGCDWLTPQHVPDGWSHDAWTFAFAVKNVDLWHPLTAAMVRHGAEMPYACWRITYQESAFRHLAPDGTCPIAEDLQPRIVQCQTNSLEAAERNAAALRKAIREVGGAR